MNRVCRLLSVLLLFTVATTTAWAQKRLLDKELDAATGTRVQVRSVFDPLPPSGYAPMRVFGMNGTGRDARWVFNFSSRVNGYMMEENRQSSVFTLDMPARSTQSALLNVPVAAGYGGPGFGYGSNVLTLDVLDTGFDIGTESSHDDRIVDFPAVAISHTLAELSIIGLDKEVESRRSSSGGHAGSDKFGSQFDVDDLPDTWLGFSGFDYVMLSSTDWQKLKPPARRAVVDWVRLGGKLHVFLSPGVEAAALGLPRLDGSSASFSLGEVSVFSWDGKRLPASETVSRYWGLDERVEDLVEGHTNQADWPLLDLLGSRSFASWQVMVFLVLFGILVGPVNLFVLAPAGKRHKLFVTTPLLSLGASLVMVVVILFQDGVGGVGRRFVAVNLVPENAAAYVTQEQVSRTGVLFGASFSLKQPVLMELVAMPDTPWAKLKRGGSGHQQMVNLAQEGPERRGNYFQSRAEQGQVLRAVVPTRARLELKAGLAAGAAPVLVSALGFTVEELLYMDAAGKVWELAGPLSTGQTATLKESSKSAINPVSAKMAPAEADLLEKINLATSSKTNFFIAKARQAPDFVVDTLSSIAWKEDEILVFGPVAQP